jgi:hypothetical protein
MGELIHISLLLGPRHVLAEFPNTVHSFSRHGVVAARFPSDRAGIFYTRSRLVECVWNVMAHAQKTEFVFRRNGRVHLNQQGRQFSRLLSAEVCASAVVMLGTPRSEVVWEYWLPTSFVSFLFTSPPVRHRVPSRFNWTLPRLPWLA